MIGKQRGKEEEKDNYNSAFPRAIKQQEKKLKKKTKISHKSGGGGCNWWLENGTDILRLMGLGLAGTRTQGWGDGCRERREKIVIDSDKGTASRRVTISSSSMSSLNLKCGKRWRWVLVFMMLGANGRGM